MDLFRAQELQEKIAQVAVGQANSQPKPWSRLEYFWSQIGSSASMYLDVFDELGNYVDVWVPDAHSQWGELRQSMSDPETGAWYSASLVMDSSGEITYSFNYDKRVYWGRHDGAPYQPDPDLGSDPDPSLVRPSDEAYIEDLESFPRAEKYRPEWFPVPVVIDIPKQVAEIEALLAKTVEVPEKYRPLLGEWGWPSVLDSVAAGIERLVRQAASMGDLPLDEAGRAKLELHLGGLLQFIDEDVANEVILDHPISSLQRLWEGAAPVIGDQADPTPVGVPIEGTVRENESDPGVDFLNSRVNALIWSLTTDWIEARFGVYPEGF